MLKGVWGARVGFRATRVSGGFDMHALGCARATLPVGTVVQESASMCTHIDTLSKTPF